MAPARPVLDQLNLVVRDMEASVTFYRRLGVAIEDRDPAWDAHHRSSTSPGEDSAGLDLDLDSRVFARRFDRGWPEGRSGVILGFRVASREDVDRLYAELTQAGHPGQQPPYDAFWGSRYAIVEDPDGNPVGLMSPPDPARRTRPELP